MKNVLVVILFAFVLSACASPNYTGSRIDDKNFDEVVVIKDLETKIGFLHAIESWLEKHKYNYTVASDGSKHNPDKLTLEYSGIWRWDLAIFLNDAEIEAFRNGQRVGEAKYTAPNNLNMKKYSDAEERINYLMDVLFGEIEANEATKKINFAERGSNAQ